MRKLLIGAAAAALISTSAQAATPGTPGASSTGSTDVTVNIDEFVNIRGLDDLQIDIAASDINEATPNNRAGQAVTQFCVFSNVNSAGAYNFSATSAIAGAAGNPFGLTGPEGTQLNYAAWYRDQPTSPFNGTYLNRNQVYSGATTAGSQARATDFNCSNVAGGNNASLGIGVRNSQALAALAGTYNGTLTVTVAVP